MKKYNSEQMLIDLGQAIGKDDPEATRLLDALSKRLKRSYYEKADAINDNHRYRKLSWSKLFNASSNAYIENALSILSNNARALFLTIVMMCNTGFIELSANTVAKILNFTNKRYANEAIKELTSAGFLIEKVKPNGRKAGIYKLNRLIYQIGKAYPEDEDHKALGIPMNDAGDILDLNSSSVSRVTTTIALSDGEEEKLIFNTLESDARIFDRAPRVVIPPKPKRKRPVVTDTDLDDLFVRLKGGDTDETSSDTE